MVKVRHLSVRNFTSLLDVDLTDLPNLVVFIGQNSSGKSNLIDALALLFSRFGTQLSVDLGSADQYHHLFPNHSTLVDQPPEIICTLTLTSYEWSQLLNVDDDEARLLEKEELLVAKRLLHHDGLVQWNTNTLDIGQWEIIRSGSSEYDVYSITLERESEDGSSAEIDVDVSVEELLPGLRKLFASAFGVVYTTESTRDWGNRFLERPTIVDDTHINNLWQQSQSTGNQRQLWTRVAHEFEQIAPNEQRPVGVASSIQMEEGTLTVPIGMIGEGSQATLRLIDQLHRGPSIMAIEEPETHLHPTLIKQVGQFLAAMANEGRQLFVCTHSPFLVEQSSLSNFFVVTKVGSETKVSAMRELDDLKSLLFDIGMRPSDVLFSDAILLVEGVSDEAFFNQLSNKVGAPLADRHIKIVRAGGYPRGKRKIEFWSEVGRDVGLPLFIILDRDAKDEAYKAIQEGRVHEGNCLILDQGSLEDCYPWNALEQTISEHFGITIEQPIAAGQRVKDLRKLFYENDIEGDSWKRLIAEEIGKHLGRGQAESEMSDIVGFLRKIYHAVGMV